MSKPVILTMNTERGELALTIGNESLTVPGFVLSVDGKEQQAVLSAYAQEKIIKRLVGNMTLKEG